MSFRLIGRLRKYRLTRRRFGPPIGRPASRSRPTCVVAKGAMSILQDFTNPEYLHALTTSIKYGLGVVIGMLGVGSALTLLGGGWSATWWNKDQGHQH